MSARRNAAARKPRPPKGESSGARPVALPDVSKVVYALSDAMALVAMASKALMERNGGVEATVLSLGVAALEKVMDDLEEVEDAIAVFRRNNGGGS